ncbi:DHA2 family efflux MFS transporter permease subunit [Pseudonocardia halophobica]|uniref:MFS transporter n=1 Tax=Pseudonocardia halophobica TaxID=29401 RepID=A0A9W6L174_9PSEU|nr:MFS transporter [Pseudonocardia halophobica]
MSETVRGRAPEELSVVDDPDLAPLPRRRAVFAVVGVALLMFSLDQTSVATALTTLERDLGATLAWTSWTVTIYAVGQILALPLGGRLGEQFGRRRVFLWAVATFTAVSCACAATTDIGQLIACRFVQGLAGGLMLPAANGIVAHAFGRDRDRALALFTSVFPIGAILGPLVGGVILTVWSWRGIFLVNLPIGALLVVAGALLIRDPPRTRVERVDVAGIVLLTLALLATMVAITRVGSIGDGVAGPVGVVVAGVVALAAGWFFLRHARRHADAVVPARLLSGGGLGIMNTTNVLFGAAIIGFSALLPLYAQVRYALLPLAAGVLLTARAIGTIASSGVSVALLRRVGHRPLLLVGLGGIVAGLVLGALPPAGVSPAVWLTAAAAVTGLGMGLAGPAANNAGMHLVRDDVTAVSGLRIMFRQIGGIAAVSVTTAAVTASDDPGLAAAICFVVLAGLLTAAAVAAARLPNHRGRW